MTADEKFWEIERLRNKCVDLTLDLQYTLNNAPKYVGTKTREALINVYRAKYEVLQFKIIDTIAIQEKPTTVRETYVTVLERSI